MAHWIEDDDTRRKFWSYVKNDLNLTEDEVHEALNIESVKDYKGKKETAVRALKQFVAVRLQRAVASFPSLPVWASTEFVSASGYRYKVCIAAGLVPVLRLAAVDQVHNGISEFEEMAANNDWTPNGYRAQRPQQPTRPAQAQGVTQLPGVIANARPAQQLPASTASAAIARERSNRPPAPPNAAGGPPPLPAGAVAPPAPATEQAQSGGTGDGGEMMTEFVKITAPKGKPVIELWRPNRKWAELKYHLGGERFLQMAPTLLEAGWVVAHFEDIGKEYPLALTITWKPSQDGKYKDIVEVKLRQ